MKGLASWALVLAALAGTKSVAAQDGDIFVAANGAACRAEPSTTAEVSTRLAVGEILPRVGTITGWTQLRVPIGACWAADFLLVPYNPTRRSQALVEAANLMLQRQPSPSANDLAQLGRLIEAQLALGDPARPLLDHAHLRLLGAAAREDYRASSDWLREHMDLLQYYESAGQYFVRLEVFQAVYEQFPSGPGADELAWEYLRRTRPGECEDDPNCMLERVRGSFVEYWLRFPNGPYVVEALQQARSSLDDVVRYACWTGQDDHTVVEPSRVEVIGASLSEVTASGREQVLALLEDIRAACD